MLMINDFEILCILYKIKTVKDNISVTYPTHKTTGTFYSVVLLFMETSGDIYRVLLVETFQQHRFVLGESG